MWLRVALDSFARDLSAIVEAIVADKNTQDWYHSDALLETKRMVLLSCKVEIVD